VQALPDPNDVRPVPPDPSRFRPETIAWWQTWAHSPQAHYFGVTEWQRLTMLLPLVEQYFLEPSVKVMAELRIHEAALGALPADRLRLNWNTSKPAKSAAVVEVDEFKARRQAEVDRYLAGDA
jgi:hypothetical protein